MIEETSELKAPVITLAKIKKKLNEEQPGSVEGTGIYEITGVKYNGQEVEGTLKVPDDGEITLQVETDTVSEDSKFYGFVQGKYYEILLENSEIELGEEKTLAEIETGAIASELTATFVKESGASTNVDIVVDQNQKEVTIKGKGVNTGRGAGIVKISYGNTRDIGIDVVETFSVTVQAETENDVPKGTIILPSSATQKYASGSVIILQTTANEGLKLKDWYDGTNVVGETNQCNYTISKNATITARYEVRKLYGEQVKLNEGNEITVGNGTIVDNWKLFYIDDTSNGYVHLIYGDYYPTEVQTDPDTGDINTINLTPNATYQWGINCEEPRLNLLKYLKNNVNYTETNLDTSIPAESYESWTDLASALTVTGKVLANKIIKVQGAPNITMWVNSWNEQGYTEIVLKDSGNSYTGYKIGKKVSSGSQKYNTQLDLHNENGYNDTLYFPYKNKTAGNGNADKAGSYWLASPGGNDYYYLCYAEYDGIVDCGGNRTITGASTRPVVSILKSDFQELFPNISITKPTNN